MFWINNTICEQTNDNAKVAEWVKNGDDIDIFVWCEEMCCYIKTKFN